jgi:hypothetical protein
MCVWGCVCASLYVKIHVNLLQYAISTSTTRRRSSYSSLPASMESLEHPILDVAEGGRLANTSSFAPSDVSVYVYVCVCIYAVSVYVYVCMYAYSVVCP